jgi:hypothetical protein
MYGGGGGGSPPPVKQIDQAELDRQQAEAAAAQNKLAGKRKGIQSTRLTDPVTDLYNGPNKPKTRVSLLGGGESGG